MQRALSGSTQHPAKAGPTTGQPLQSTQFDANLRSKFQNCSRRFVWPGNRSTAVAELDTTGTFVDAGDFTKDLGRALRTPVPSKTFPPVAEEYELCQYL